MNIFDPEKNKAVKAEDENGSANKRQLFARSDLNDWVPIWEKIAFFLIGWLGLNIVSVIVANLFALSIKLNGAEEIVFSVRQAALINFLSYMIIFIAIACLLFLDKRKTYVRFFKSFTKGKAIGLAFSGFGVILVVNYIFSMLYSFIPIYGDNVNQSVINEIAVGSPVLTFFTVVLFGPICEEFTYRLGLADAIGRKNRWLGLALSSVIFAFIHFDWQLVFSLFIADEEQTATLLPMVYNELLNIPLYLIPGFVLGFLYMHTGEISSAITCHVVNNLFSFVMIFVAAGMGQGDSSSSLLRLFHLC